MQPHIGRWHCRYRVSQEQPEAAVAAGRLERAVRPRMLDAYAQAIALTDASDPTVYVVRRVRLDLTLVGSVHHSEIVLARRWGERACAAVVRRVIAHAADPAEVARFADTPDYIASFIADLLQDVAWDRWYYGAFAKLRHMPLGEAILALLAEHREHLAAILQALARRGCLRDVLDLLGEDGARVVWGEGVQHAPPVVREAEVWVFVRAAFRLLDMLRLWAAAPSEGDLFTASVVRQSVPPEWTDGRSLAFAVFAVLRAADREGLLMRPRTGALRLWRERRHEILAELDWLDVEWISDAIEAWLTGNDAEVATAVLPARRAGASPSQRLILERLAALLRETAIPIDHRAAASEANALRLYAALASTDTELAAHAATPSLIRLLLSCLQWLLTADRPAIAIEAIRSGTIERVLGGVEAAAHHALRAAAAIGGPAADVLERLVPAARAAAFADESLRVETGCAGLFLLVRALTDTRFVQMVSAVDLPASPVLLALGIQWAGMPAWHEGRFDPGLALWAAVPPGGEPLDSLRALERGACDTLFDRVVDLLRERRALDRAVEIVEVSPESWTSDLAIAWPASIALPPPLVGLAVHLLKLWARWLPGIGASSVPYLLANLVRRRGVVQIGVHTLDVALDPAPLDVVMDMAGYLGSVSAVPWLDGRRLALRIDRTRR